MFENERNEKRIRLLARIYHYSILAVFLLSIFFSDYSNQVAGGYFIFAGLWMLVGCALKWTHIYCAYQSIRIKPLTPENPKWTAKARAALIILGLALIGIGIFFAFFVRLGE